MWIVILHQGLTSCMILKKLLSLIPGLNIIDLQAYDNGFRISLNLKRSTARCPLCNTRSSIVHSKYKRVVSDLPWAGLPVYFFFQVRKFFCRNEKCKQSIFAERLGPSLPAYQRRTQRLNCALIQICHSCTAESGARLARFLGMPISPDTMIRLLLEKNPGRFSGSVRVLGVDDWAFKKGCHYGTILVDLERKCPIDLLPDRSTETLTDWLKEHPEIEIISRDRADCYAKAATNGAPNAIQVADRWHLFKNLGEATQRLLAKYPLELKEATNKAFNCEAYSEGEIIESLEATIAEEDQRGQNEQGFDDPKNSRRNAGRRLNFERVKQMQKEGMGIKATARELGITRTTVRKYRALESFPERAKPVSRLKANPFREYLWQRWKEGEKSGIILYREIQRIGFDGWPSSVYRLLEDFPGYPEKARKPKAPKKIPMLSPRKASRIFTREKAKPNQKEEVFCDFLEQCHPVFEAARPEIQEFGCMLRGGMVESFESWLASAEETKIPEYTQFAKSLRGDLDAVKAAIALPWSNGQVEGQVNRLKTIKRSMYGTCRFELLRTRILGST